MPNIVFDALRGPFSAEHLKRKGIAQGDPALFIGDYFQERKKRIKIGVVPHHDDLDSNLIRQMSSHLRDAVVIDVGEEPLEVTRQISECEVILSSSLHGLIVADAFGIPNARLKISDRMIGGDWKFQDYAGAIGRKNIQPIDSAAQNFAETVALQDMDYLSNIPAVLSGLRRSFAFF